MLTPLFWVIRFKMYSLASSGGSQGCGSLLPCPLASGPPPPHAVNKSASVPMLSFVTTLVYVPFLFLHVCFLYQALLDSPLHTRRVNQCLLLHGNSSLMNWIKLKVICQGNPLWGAICRQPSKPRALTDTTRVSVTRITQMQKLLATKNRLTDKNRYCPI